VRRSVTSGAPGAPHGMKLSTATRFAALALLLATLLPIASAAVERLDLGTMVERADAGIVGTITRQRVVRVDHPLDGPELYYTFLTIEGRVLGGQELRTVEVLFAGGFLDRTQGVWNSEAPAADEVALGKRVVAFYKYTPNAGGDVAGNALYAAHGGLFRTFEARRGTIVQGRGEGYAVDGNLTLDDLEARVRVLTAAKLARLEEERRAREAAESRREPRK